MSFNFPLSDHEHTPSLLMDTPPKSNLFLDCAEDAAFHHLSNLLPPHLLRPPPPCFAAPSPHPPAAPPLPPQPHPHPSRTLATSFSLRDLLLARDITSASALAGSASIVTAESRGSCDLSSHLDSPNTTPTDLQSLWDLINAAPANSQQLPRKEGSFLNPATSAIPESRMDEQVQLRQQLSHIAAAMMPRSSPLPQPPTTSNRTGAESSVVGHPAQDRTPSKRQWADCHYDSSSHPSSPPPRSRASSLSALASPGTPSLAGPAPGLQPRGSPREDKGSRKKNEVENASDGKEGSRRECKEQDWEPRVRRKKARSSSISDEDGGAASEDGTLHIKAKSMTERQRRDRISDALRRLRGEVNSHGDMATMLNEAVELIQQQKRRLDDVEMQILQQRLRQQLAGGFTTTF